MSQRFSMLTQKYERDVFEMADVILSIDADNAHGKGTSWRRRMSGLRVRITSIFDFIPRASLRPTNRKRHWSSLVSAYAISFLEGNVLLLIRILFSNDPQY